MSSFGRFFTIDDSNTSDNNNEVTVVPPPWKKERKSSPMRANPSSKKIPQVVFGSVPAFATLDSDGDGDESGTHFMTSVW
jgi:hypothetical protein